jgi:hypothetical protein
VAECEESRRGGYRSGRKQGDEARKAIEVAVSEKRKGEEEGYRSGRRLRKGIGRRRAIEVAESEERN